MPARLLSCASAEGELAIPRATSARAPRRNEQRHGALAWHLSSRLSDRGCGRWGVGVSLGGEGPTCSGPFCLDRFSQLPVVHLDGIRRANHAPDVRREAMHGITYSQFSRHALTTGGNRAPHFGSERSTGSVPRGFVLRGG